MGVAPPSETCKLAIRPAVVRLQRLTDCVSRNRIPAPQLGTRHCSLLVLAPGRAKEEAFLVAGIFAYRVFLSPRDSAVLGYCVCVGCRD